MKRLGLVVIAAVIVISGYFLLKPSGEQEPAPSRPTPVPQPSPSVTSPAAPDSTGDRPSIREPQSSSPTESPKTPQAPPSPTASSAEPPSLFTEFEAQPVDPQWSEENEIRLENYLFANENFSELDIEGIQCKASLCEIRVYEKANTVWARVVHNLARDQGWNQTSWRYADYYDKDGKRLIRTVVGQKPQ